MRLSYAQRLEDYHLERVFGDRGRGTYIDVGAGHPIADNVSYWFYLKGWNGLVIEPQRDLLQLYPHIRPRDIAVQALVGRQRGEADFHIVDRLHGLSTTIAANTGTARELGAAVSTVRMPVSTLGELAATHGFADVDFLKIDVEGAEADVIAGADWQRCRPRVVLVEALHPGSMVESWSHWEPQLVAQNYRFAFFDGLNRFYVAEEAADLIGRFPREPAPWDAVEHLWDYGRADQRSDHPDHALARALVHGFLASLPRLDKSMLRQLLMVKRMDHAADGSAAPQTATQLLLGNAEFPGPCPAGADALEFDALCDVLMDADRFRAALGRIASAYDGGHITD